MHVTSSIPISILDSRNGVMIISTLRYGFFELLFSFTLVGYIMDKSKLPLHQ